VKKGRLDEEEYQPSSIVNFDGESSHIGMKDDQTVATIVMAIRRQQSL
jgi:hypothetical protein